MLQGNCQLRLRLTVEGLFQQVITVFVLTQLVRCAQPR